MRSFLIAGLLLLSACASSRADRKLASQLPELKLHSRTLKNPNTYRSGSDENAVLLKLLKGSEQAFDLSNDPEDEEAKLYLAVSQAQDHAKSNPDYLANLLSTPELVALIHYTQRGYKNLNSALWAGEYGGDPKTLEKKILVLLSAVNRLPLLTADIRRGEMYEFEFIKKKDPLAAKKRYDSYIAEEEFVAKGFWSATRATKIESRGRFLRNAMIIYKIRSKTGRNIEEISFYPEEEEVLFLPNTRFKVKSKQILERAVTQEYPFDYAYEVTLEELD